MRVRRVPKTMAFFRLNMSRYIFRWDESDFGCVSRVIGKSKCSAHHWTERPSGTTTNPDCIANFSRKCVRIDWLSGATVYVDSPLQSGETGSVRSRKLCFSKRAINPSGKKSCAMIWIRVNIWRARWMIRAISEAESQGIVQCGPMISLSVPSCGISVSIFATIPIIFSLPHGTCTVLPTCTNGRKWSGRP